MYIANLAYLKPLSEVERYLEEHVAFSDRCYEAGKSVCSGRKNPRIGGVILLHTKDGTEMKQIISEDSSHISGITNYEMIEFNPTKYTSNFWYFTE